MEFARIWDEFDDPSDEFRMWKGMVHDDTDMFSIFSFFGVWTVFSVFEIRTCLRIQASRALVFTHFPSNIDPSRSYSLAISVWYHEYP